MSKDDEAHNLNDTINTAAAEMREAADEILRLKEKIRLALAVADEETVYRCGGKPKHIRMAEILRGK